MTRSFKALATSCFALLCVIVFTSSKSASVSMAQTEAATATATGTEDPVDQFTLRMNALQDKIGDTLQESLTEPGFIKTTSTDGILTIYATNEFFATHPDEVQGKLFFDQATVDRLEDVIIVGWVWQMEGSKRTSLKTIVNNKQKYIDLLKKNTTLKIPAHSLSNNSSVTKLVSKVLKPGGITFVRLGINAHYSARWASSIQTKGDYGVGIINDSSSNDVYILAHRRESDALLKSRLLFVDIVNELKATSKSINTLSDEETLYLFPQFATNK